jgi:hypothetical protein
VTTPSYSLYGLEAIPADVIVEGDGVRVVERGSGRTIADVKQEPGRRTPAGVQSGGPNLVRRESAPADLKKDVKGSTCLSRWDGSEAAAGSPSIDPTSMPSSAGWLTGDPAGVLVTVSKRLEPRQAGAASKVSRCTLDLDQCQSREAPSAPPTSQLRWTHRRHLRGESAAPRRAHAIVSRASPRRMLGHCRIRRQWPRAQLVDPTCAPVLLDRWPAGVQDVTGWSVPRMPLGKRVECGRVRLCSCLFLP